MCFGASAPALWWSIPEDERARRGELSSDQCVIDGQHFFVLGRIQIPVFDHPDPFTWLCWVSLSEKNFLRACELWKMAGRETESPYFGWVQSALPYEPPTLSLAADVITMPLGERPLIRLHEYEHPLYRQQVGGISIAQVQEIVERVLHPPPGSQH